MLKKYLLIVIAVFAVLSITNAVTVTGGGDYSLESDGTCNDGLSGICYAGSNQYYAANDSGGVMQPLTIVVNSANGAVSSVSCSTAIHLGGSDLEGIAYNAAKDSVFVCNESGATIMEYTTDTNGTYISAVDIPVIYSSYRENMSLESLTIRGDGLEMWTCNEQALSNANNNVNDGPVVSGSNGTTVRLQRFTRSSVHSSWTTNEQYAYLSNSGEDGGAGGVSDLCVLPDGTLLVLERWQNGASLYNEIYEIDYSGATDISSIQSLQGASYTRVTKTSRWNHSFSYFGTFYNFEGMCLAPRLTSGELSLLLISDGDDSPDKGLYYLTVSGLSVRTLRVASDYGESGAEPMGYPCRYVYGTVLTNTVINPAVNGTTQGVCTGWALTGGDSPVSGVTNTMTMTINNDGALNWIWGETNYLLDTEMSGSGLVTPGDSWVSPGSNATLTAAASPRYTFTGWIGDVLAGHENDNPLTVTMDQSRQITAIFAENCGVNTTNTILYSETFESYTNGFPISGTNGWSSSAFSAAVISTNYLLVDSLNNYSKECGYPVDSANHAKVLKVNDTVTNSFDMTNNQIIWMDNIIQTDALILTNNDAISSTDQLAFYFNTNGHPVIYHYDLSTGTNRWTEILDVTVDNSSWVRVTFKLDYQTDDAVNFVRYFQVFIDGNKVTNNYAWTANDGSGVAGGSWFAMPFEPDKMIRVVFVGSGAGVDDVVVSADDPLARDIEINSQYGIADPPAGTNGYTYGDVITISVTNSPVTEGATQYVCTGWIMTGNTPTNGTGTNVTITLTNDVVMIWQWDTNYWLDTEVVTNGTVIPGDDWYLNGTNVTITPLASPRYKFSEWTGDIPAGHENDNPLTVTMEQVRTITAGFAENCGPNTTNTVVYKESFESYTDGFELPGTNGWSAGSLAAATISMDTNIMYQLTNTYNGVYPLETNHTKVLKVTSDTTNMIYGSGFTYLAIDSMVWVKRYYSMPDISSNAQSAFYVDENGLVNILHAYTTNGVSFSNTWHVLTNSPTLGDEEWARFTIIEDFSSMMFSIQLNGGFAIEDADGWTDTDTQPGTWFYMPDRSRYYLSSVTLKNSMYLDDLVVSDIVPTLVVISAFYADTVNDEVVVSWDIELESGTIGYYLERKTDSGWVRVNDQLISRSPFGSNDPPYHYSVVDPGAESCGTYTWRVVELDNQGRLTSYGPYTVTVDGVPISYETWAAGIDWNGLDSSRDGDADGDGFSNFEEYLAHTDPMDANSLLQITSLSSVDNNVVVRWQSASGAVYSVEFSSDIEGNWLPIINDIPATPPSNVETISLDTVTTPQMFFKVIEK